MARSGVEGVSRLLGVGWGGQRGKEGVECEDAAAGDASQSFRAARIPRGQKGSFRSRAAGLGSSRVFSAGLQLLRVLPLLQASL